MLHSAAFASRVVASTPIVLPFTKPTVASRSSTREIVELLIREQTIQTCVERVTWRNRQIRRGDPHLRLSVAFSFAQRHGQSVVQGPNPGPQRAEVGE